MFRQLTLTQRQIIEDRLKQGASQSAIARAIGVHRSTVKKEVERNSVQGNYEAHQAQRLAQSRHRKGSRYATQQTDRQLRSGKRPTFLYGYFSDIHLSWKEPTCSTAKNSNYCDKGRKRKRNFFGYYYAPSTQQEIKRMCDLMRRRRCHWLEKLKRNERGLYWKYFHKRPSMMMSYHGHAPYRRIVKYASSGFIKGKYYSRQMSLMMTQAHDISSSSSKKQRGPLLPSERKTYIHTRTHSSLSPLTLNYPAIKNTFRSPLPFYHLVRNLSKKGTEARSYPKREGKQEVNALHFAAEKPKKYEKEFLLIKQTHDLPSFSERNKTTTGQAPDIVLTSPIVQKDIHQACQKIKSYTFSKKSKSSANSIAKARRLLSLVS